MSNILKLSEVVQPEFRTSEAASKKNETMANRLGTARYGPARLALALSLADKSPIKEGISDTKGNAIRGRTLFGDDADMATWIALITEHAGRTLDKPAFTTQVAIHWERGINLLSKIWDGAGGDFERFIVALAEKSDMPQITGARPDSPSPLEQNTILPPVAIDLSIGTFDSGTKRGQSAQWRINAPGDSPHIAVMGAPGGGKTRLALDFVKAIKEKSDCSTFLFDMKGDIATDNELRRKLGAQVISPATSVPLDILHVAKKDNASVQNAAASLCASVGFASGGALGPKQKTTLRETAADLINELDSVSLNLLCDAYREKIGNEDSVSATLARMCALELFKPEIQPARFFSRNWIFDLHNDAQEIQRFSSLMILDALHRHFMALPDAPVDAEGNRQIQTLLVIDEAHKILGHKLSALSDIARMSRSKGGAVILISQSPNDFQEEDNLLEYIGLTVSYRTNATPASVRKVFFENFAVSDLKTGVCAVRFPGKPTQKIKVWG